MHMYYFVFYENILPSSTTLTVTITDMNECTAVDSIFIAQLDFGAEFQPIDCHGGFDGSIEVIPFGGFPPYQINWEDGVVGPFNSNLPAGDHPFTITDSIGCQLEASYPLFEPDPMLISNIMTKGNS